MRLIKRFAAGAAAMSLCLSLCACEGGLMGLFESSDSSGAEAPDISEAESSAETTAQTTTTEAVSSSEEETDSSSADSEESSEEESEPEPEPDIAEELRAVLPDIELENKTVRRLAHFDILPAADGRAMPSSELFEKVYGGNVEYVPARYNERYNVLAELVMAGEAPDIFPTDDMDTFPKGAIHKLFAPTDEYIDFSGELWSDMSDRSSFFEFDGERYGAVVEEVPTFVCIYNKKTIADNSLDDPAKLYADGEWDFESFARMCGQFTDASADKFGLDGYYFSQALSESNGVPLLTMESGGVISNLSDPRLEEVQDKMYSLAQSGVCFDISANDWLPRGKYDVGSGMAEGLTLFYPAGLWALYENAEQAARFGDISAGDVMFVPMPESSSGEQYMSAYLRGYYFVAGAKNPEGAAAYLDCLKAAAEFDYSAEDERLADQLGWTDEMLAMRRECYRLAKESPVISCAEGVPKDGDENRYYDILAGSMLPGSYAKRWEDTVEAVRKQLDYTVLTINDTEPMGP